MESVRTFIAFDTPQAIHGDINKLQQLLKETGADVTWESHEKFHVTIKFLGDVNSSMIDPLIERIQQTAERSPRFEVRYTDLGCFPDKHHPKIIWIGCENNDGKLDFLKKSLDKGLIPLGFQIEHKPFKPHVTLGRVKSERNISHLLSMLEKLTFEPRIATIGEIIVMKSVLHPLGANYSILKSIQLPPS